MSKLRDRAWYALFTVPLLFIFVTVVILPFLIGIGYSFMEWDGIPADPKTFVGLGNFVRLLHDGRFLSSVWHTLEFTVLALILVNVGGLLMALVVTSGLRTSTPARTLFFMPNLIGGLILGFIWQFIFNDTFSFIGDKTGYTGFFFDWLIHPQFALYAIVIVFAWQMAGYTMIIYIAGIQGIPSDLIEAAKIDGADFRQRLTRIVFPLLMPAFTICIFLTLSYAFKMYDVNLSLTKGGPANATELFAMNIFNEIFGYGHYGFGQAKAIVFFLIVAIFTLSQVAFTKRREVQM